MSASIIHPILLEFIHHVEDDYWKLLYEDMAFGKFPSGVYIQKNFFCCFHKGKEFSVELKPNNFSVFTQIHSLLSTNMGIKSEKEKSKFKDTIIENQKVKDPKRLIKDVTLTSFIIKKGEQYKLPDNIIRKIFSLFILGFMFKTLLVKDVVFNGNEIHSIKGFAFTDKKVRINKNILELRRNQIHLDYDTPKVEANVLTPYWHKYIHNISLFNTATATDV